MNIIRTERGFTVLEHEVYPPKEGQRARLAQQSSAIGNYEDSFDKPGSSYLWIGDNHHLNREEVAQLVAHLQNWLRTGGLG